MTKFLKNTILSPGAPFRVYYVATRGQSNIYPEIRPVGCVVFEHLIDYRLWVLPENAFSNRWGVETAKFCMFFVYPLPHTQIKFFLGQNDTKFPMIT